jgi:hypothetical protein
MRWCDVDMDSGIITIEAMHTKTNDLSPTVHQGQPRADDVDQASKLWVAGSNPAGQTNAIDDSRPGSLPALQRADHERTHGLANRDVAFQGIGRLSTDYQPPTIDAKKRQPGHG